MSLKTKPHSALLPVAAHGSFHPIHHPIESKMCNTWLSSIISVYFTLHKKPLYHSTGEHHHITETPDQVNWMGCVLHGCCHGIWNIYLRETLRWVENTMPLVQFIVGTFINSTEKPRPFEADRAQRNGAGSFVQELVMLMVKRMVFSTSSPWHCFAQFFSSFF